MNLIELKNRLDEALKEFNLYVTDTMLGDALTSGDGGTSYVYYIKIHEDHKVE